MKDQFYVVLPSNSSMRYFPHNTTTRFTTQLPQQIRLQGEWVVALTEIQIPLTIPHIPLDEEERSVNLLSEPSDLAGTKLDISFVKPGIYKDAADLVEEMNRLECLKGHIKFKLMRGNYVAMARVCNIACDKTLHVVKISKTLRKILGFESHIARLYSFSPDVMEICGDHPANLTSVLPDSLLIYCDIVEPFVIGDVQARLLRSVDLGVDRYTYGNTKTKSFPNPMYLPLLINTFQTIEIDLRCQLGKPIPFDFGLLTVTLHFKRID